MPNAFSPYPPRDWQQIATALRDVLTPDEYTSARASTPNAHYTSPDVIQAVWHALEQFGLPAGATILEPSMGVGHFFGFMPEHLYSGFKRTGVELDSVTGRIAAKLYPDSTVHQKGYEEAFFPRNFFDAAIGNIPFGNYPVYDAVYARTPKLTRAIHDYFLAKTVDVVRPGGIVALITSRYTLDKQDSTVRDYLADRAMLLGAIRLPNTAFKENAGTTVTADILFLQKHGHEKQADAPEWRQLGTVETDQGKIEINQYFTTRPEMMLGTMTIENGLYGAPSPALTGTLDSQALAGAVSKLPSDIYQSREQAKVTVPLTIAQVPEPAVVKHGGLTERDGQIAIRRGDRYESLTLSASASTRIRGMLKIRDAVRDVFRSQLTESSEKTILDSRLRLNTAYDSFVSQFGPLNKKENAKAFSEDPDGPLLLSLEDVNPETGQVGKTAVFERSTLERYRPVTSVETASEALLISLNEFGRLEWTRMEALTRRLPSELQYELGSLIYRNPEGGEWETADHYLSGNVRAKLQAAEAASLSDPRFERNAEALRWIQPEDLLPGDIEARLGSTWIPTADVRDFVAELLGIPANNVKIGLADAIATWTVEPDNNAKYIVSNRTTHGTSRFRATELIEQALNGRTPTAYDEDGEGNRIVNQPETVAAREKQQQLKDRFRDWIWEDRGRAERSVSTRVRPAAKKFREYCPCWKLVD